MREELLKTAADLADFFSPRSLAIVGASDDVAKYGGQVFQQVLRFGYAGRIYPVNPRRKTLKDLQCYPDLLSLPEAPDHVGIAVPRDKVLATLAECKARGVRFATVLTSGFAESGTADGIALQKEIVEFARSAGIRFMGPNCNGVVNFVDRFSLGSSTTASFSVPRKDKNIAIVGQSGGLGQVNVMWRAIDAGLGVNYQVSCGNEADLDLVDFAAFALLQESTEVLLMAIEGIRDAGKFIEVAEHAAENGKPIVALKFGRSELGQKMAASHTGSLAGTDAIFDAACRQFGIIRVEDCNQLYETAIALRGRRMRRRGRKVAAVAPSGGNAVQVADLGATLGLEWPPFSSASEDRLRHVYPGRIDFANPLDTQNVQGTLVPSLETIEPDPGFDVLVAVFTMINRASIDRVAALAQASKKLVVVLWTGRCTDGDYTVSNLVDAGIPAYSETLACLSGILAAARYEEFLAAFRNRKTLQHPSASALQSARNLIQASTKDTLTERESKSVFALYGIPVTVERLATSAEEALCLAMEIGLPVAMKIESPDIAHKTEAGGVRLNLQSEEEIRSAYRDILAATQAYAPNAKLNGVLVQAMAQPGVEIIIGIVTDSVFGPVIVVGLGGIHVEVFRDAAYRLPPVDHTEAMSMIRELRAYRLLEGVRGQARLDIEALASAIVRASWMAHDMRDLVEEVDINPILLTRKGACAVDALIVKKANPHGRLKSAGI